MERYRIKEGKHAVAMTWLSCHRFPANEVLITSNLVFNDWEPIFKDPMATATAFDRLVHHAVILEFNVPSYRTRKRRWTEASRPADGADARPG